MAFVRMHNVMNSFMEQIEQVIALKVEAKLQDMVTNRNTLQLMDETMMLCVEAMVENAMDHHTQNCEHHDWGTMENIAADQARETMKEYAERQEGWVTQDRVNDIVTERIDEEIDAIDWDERVKEVLREML
jgi:delta 1-pyrroline-5-carboxylate dehydrogenase